MAERPRRSRACCAPIPSARTTLSFATARPIARRAVVVRSSPPPASSHGAVAAFGAGLLADSSSLKSTGLTQNLGQL